MTQEKRKKDSKEIPDPVSELLDEVTSKGKALINEGLESARDMFDEKKEFIKEKAEELKDVKVGEIAEEAKDFVKKNPWMSLAIAAGLGFIIGSILKSDD